MKNSKNPPSSVDKPPVEAPIYPPKTEEIGGQKGLEPTRYGDWEKNGRVSDF